MRLLENPTTLGRYEDLPRPSIIGVRPALGESGGFELVDQRHHRAGVDPHRRADLLLNRPFIRPEHVEQGRGQLYLDGTLVAQIEMPFTTPVAFNPGGLHCGANPRSPVVDASEALFHFTGHLHTVVIDVSGELITDSEAEMASAMAHQ